MTDEPQPKSPREWVASVLLSGRVPSAAAWARKAGVSKTTIGRILDTSYQFNPSSTTLSKLSKAVSANFLNENVVSYGEVDYPPVGSGKLAISGELRAGVWVSRSADTETIKSTASDFAGLRNVPLVLQSAFSIADGHAAPVFHKGDQLLCVSLHPREGDFIVVERYSEETDSFERTVGKVLTSGVEDLFSFVGLSKGSKPEELLYQDRTRQVRGISARYSSTIAALYRSVATTPLWTIEGRDTT